MQVADHTDNALWLGPQLGFNLGILERAERASIDEMAAGKPKATYIWEAACMLNDSVAEAAAVSTS